MTICGVITILNMIHDLDSEKFGSHFKREKFSVRFDPTCILKLATIFMIEQSEC